MKDPAIQCAGPDQTRVAECSIGDGDRDSTDDVVENVMVRHFTNWIGARITAVAYGENHLSGGNGAEKPKDG